MRMTDRKANWVMAVIVPVSSYPSWLRSPDLRTIDLCAPAGDGSANQSIAGVSAWRIPDPIP